MGTGPQEKEPQGSSGSHPTCICTASLRGTVLEQHITLHSPAQLNQEAKQPGSYIPGALCLQFICSKGAVGLAAALVAFG